MIIKIFDTFNAELKNIWDDCFIDSNSTIFQEYQWLYHWHITFSDFLQTKLYINVIYKNNTVIGILPLCINNRNKLSILEWIGVGVSDYLQPIIKSKEKITIDEYNFIFEKVLKDNKYIDLIHLTNIPDKIRGYKSCFVESHKCKKISSSYRIIIDSDFNEFVKDNNSVLKSVKDLKRLENNLNKIDQTKYLEHRDYKNRFLATNQMISLKEKQYNTSGVKNIFENNVFKKFYLELLKYRNFQKKIHISSLVQENNVIAVHYGLVDDYNYYYLMPAYSDKWKKSSPGGILMKKIIEYAFNNKFHKFDFLPGNENYKIKWSNNMINTYEYILPISAKGYILYSFIKIKNLLKKSAFIKKNLYFFKVKLKNYKKK